MYEGILRGRTSPAGETTALSRAIAATTFPRSARCVSGNTRVPKWRARELSLAEEACSRSESTSLASSAQERAKESAHGWVGTM